VVERALKSPAAATRRNFGEKWCLERGIETDEEREKEIREGRR
jgi:hypothetical protein